MERSHIVSSGPTLATASICVYMSRPVLWFLIIGDSNWSAVSPLSAGIRTEWVVNRGHQQDSAVAILYVEVTVELSESIGSYRAPL